MGMLKVVVTLAGYLYPRIRLIEDELPDAIAVGDLRGERCQRI